LRLIEEPYVNEEPYKFLSYSYGLGKQISNGSLKYTRHVSSSKQQHYNGKTLDHGGIQTRDLQPSGLKIKDKILGLNCTKTSLLSFIRKFRPKLIYKIDPQDPATGGYSVNFQK
jgi:hypothetical protein